MYLKPRPLSVQKKNIGSTGWSAGRACTRPPIQSPALHGPQVVPAAVSGASRHWLPAGPRHNSIF